MQNLRDFCCNSCSSFVQRCLEFPNGLSAFNFIGNTIFTALNLSSSWEKKPRRYDFTGCFHLNIYDEWKYKLEKQSECRRILCHGWHALKVFLWWSMLQLVSKWRLLELGRKYDHWFDCWSASMLIWRKGHYFHI